MNQLIHQLGTNQCFELLEVVNNMNDLGSYDFKPLGTINLSRLWMI